ncbi:NUDIX domain-containing protein [Nocardia sp. NEAU-G5]|uniref:NUDIX domain-containing protein n=1 Tax=Nocardia albiluteola TaxID=2842303 RepID=A0ABS6AXL1_9NOCA|nr:NUDIX domain-containing protein [Nocardia albiluteola]MBU3061931.1 NUDIX domain-containing protein [Nocardia albiluteola]
MGVFGCVASSSFAAVAELMTTPNSLPTVLDVGERFCPTPGVTSAGMGPATAVVADIIAGITPFDDLEQRHMATTLDWLGSTDDIFRRAKPATPSPHLVAYVVLIDPRERGVYLGQHLKAGLHLPMGGHVEPGEHPLAAARREAAEELGIEALFDLVGDAPLFLTRTTTVGQTAGHIDVSLWFVARGERAREYPLDPDEFAGGLWWDLDPYGLPATDPHLPRFIRKLDSVLTPQAMP